jgi:hypothetical protein
MMNGRMSAGRVPDPLVRVIWVMVRYPELSLRRDKCPGTDRTRTATDICTLDEILAIQQGIRGGVVCLSWSPWEQP